MASKYSREQILEILRKSHSVQHALEQYPKIKQSTLYYYTKKYDIDIDSTISPKPLPPEKSSAPCSPVALNFFNLRNLTGLAAALIIVLGFGFFKPNLQSPITSEFTKIYSKYPRKERQMSSARCFGELSSSQKPNFKKALVNYKNNFAPKKTRYVFIDSNFFCNEWDNYIPKSGGEHQ